MCLYLVGAEHAVQNLLEILVNLLHQRGRKHFLLRKGGKILTNQVGDGGYAALSEQLFQFGNMCNDGWLQGWHERNGGNLTYRMTAAEVAACRPYFDAEPREWVNMGVQADNLAGEYFITTGSDKFFRNVEPDPIHSMW